MEVHHHPNVEKKSFKEYLLEGLMIFLAVSLGFIAENIRESITEHEKAKVFAESMLEDLSADQEQLKVYRKYFAESVEMADTLMQLLSDNDPKTIPTGKLYWYGLRAGARQYFVANDATFQQMKNSGSLRYFNKEIANDVAKYDRFCRQMLKNEELTNPIYSEVRKSRSLIFYFKFNEIANSIYQSNKIIYNKKKVDSFLVSNPPLLSYDKDLFNQYVEMVRSRFMRTNVLIADSLLKQGDLLIKHLNTVYLSKQNK